MTQTHCRFRGRAEQRGTAIFIVVLVVTLLTGIGIFAARVTGSVDAATGYARQSAQARALAVYAAQIAPGLLANDKESISIQMDLAKSSGLSTQCPTNLYQMGAECAVRGHQDVARIVKSLPAGDAVLTPQSPSTPGSLGPTIATGLATGVEGNLRVEYFERAAAPPPSGNSKGSNGASPTTPLEYGITASAQIRPIIGAANNDWCSTDNESTTANVQAVRMYVTVP